METTYSSQVWNINDGGPGYSLLRSKLPHLLFSSLVHERCRFVGSPCQLTKKNSWHGRVPQTLTKETTLFSLPTSTLSLDRPMIYAKAITKSTMNKATSLCIKSKIKYPENSKDVYIYDHTVYWKNYCE